MEAMEPKQQPQQEGEDAYARAKYQENKARVIAAYNNRGKHGDDFLNVVIDFAKVKLFHLERQFAKTGTALTVDDFAQEIVITVWNNLERTFGAKGKGNDGESFYNWLHRICFTRAADFFHVLRDKSDNYTTLTVQSRFKDSNEDEERDNPELFDSGVIDNGIFFPDGITALERIVLGLMTTPVYDPNRRNFKYGTRDGALDEYRPKGGDRGMNYKEVAATLRASRAPAGEDWSNVTEDVVKKTVARVRAKVKEKRKRAFADKDAFYRNHHQKNLLRRQLRQADA